MIRKKRFLFALSLVLFCSPREATLGLALPFFKIGVASWYSESDPAIHFTTANGEIFDDSRLTCASWDFPFHTRLRVTNLANDRSVVCQVNDRGPMKRLNRLIDLTKSAFQKIAPLRFGLIRVKVEIVRPHQEAP